MPPSGQAFPADVAERCVQACSLALQLLEEAEENATAQDRRALEDEGRRREESGSWERNLGLLRDLGLDESAIADALREPRWRTARSISRSRPSPTEVPQAGEILQKIVAERERTAQALERIYGAPLAQARPGVHGRLERRREALEPLHAHQIDLLREWRKMDGPDAERILPSLLLTINAISSGLGATG